jgi:hypothetical protein
MTITYLSFYKANQQVKQNKYFYKERPFYARINFFLRKWLQ